MDWKVELKETELATLITMATGDKFLQASYGPRHVTVDLSNTNNKWMIEPLAKMRGVTSFDPA